MSRWIWERPRKETCHEDKSEDVISGGRKFKWRETHKTNMSETAVDVA